jgi:hypothetical protein
VLHKTWLADLRSEDPNKQRKNQLNEMAASPTGLDRKDASILTHRSDPIGRSNKAETPALESRARPATIIEEMAGSRLLTR